MLSHAIEVLGWTLLHFVWQGAVVGVLAATMLLALRRRSANARYLTAVSALSLMLLLPLGTMAWMVRTPLPGNISPVFTTALNIEMPRTPALGESPINVERIDFENPPLADAVPSVPVAQARTSRLEGLSERRAAFELEPFVKPFIPWAVAVWLIGVGVLSLRLSASWLCVQRLRRRATQPASENWQALLGRLAERLRVTRPVKLVESALVEVPAVIGWLRPVILLPASVMTGLTTEQLEALLAHELAHVRRHDYLVNLLQTMVETLLFYHPAVWWVSHRIRVEREHCCDDLAAIVCGDRLGYALALVAMEELRAPKLGLAMSSSGGSLLLRIARLLGRATPSEKRSTWVVGAVLLALVGVFGVAWAIQEPPDPDDREYSITLDNGVSVRLVAVCDLTLNEEKNWWRPNGAALREPVKFIQVYGKGSRNIGEGREFALEIEGLAAGQHAQVLVNENGAGSVTHVGDGSTPLRSVRATSNLRAFDGYFAVSHRRADVQVRLTDGDWGPWQRVTPDGHRDLQAIPNELRALYEEVELKQVQDSGRVELGWQLRFDIRAQIDVRVVDVDDVIHRERSSSSGSATGSQLGFTVPRNRVRWVEYRLWPMSREVTFQNISLQPDLRTNVTIGERRLIAKPNAVPSPTPTSTHCLATWSAQMDSPFKDELLAASQATRIHDLPAGQVFIVDADSLRERVQQRLATNDRSVRLVEGLTWLRSSDEVGGLSSRTSSYFHLRADPGFDGSATLWGDFSLTVGDPSGRLVVNGQWEGRGPQNGQARTALNLPLAFAADLKDNQAVVMAFSMPDSRIGLVVAEYVRVPINRWGEISRARDARQWLVIGPKLLLALGAGLPTPPDKPIEGLPDSGSDRPRDPKINESGQTGDLRSDEVAGAGDPRRAQEGVRPAIERGVVFLKSRQVESGQWPELHPSMNGGVSSLCVLALLQSGVKPDDSVVQNALTSLRKINPDKTYTVALQTMVFCAASPKEDAELIRRNVAWIEKAQVADGTMRGAWSYGIPAGGRGDGSCSRFAVLGLHAAKKAGFDVQAETWRRVSDYYLTTQTAEGGWSYSPPGHPSLSMTLAGVGSLATANRYLPQDDQTKAREAAIHESAEYLEKRLPIESTMPSTLYGFHCLERAGHVSGITQFGKLDWKADATKRLLDRQGPTGSWSGNGIGENSELIATSLALLALTGQPEPKVEVGTIRGQD